MAAGGDCGGAYIGYPNDVYANLPVTTEMHITYINKATTDDGQGRVIISMYVLWKHCLMKLETKYSLTYHIL